MEKQDRSVESDFLLKEYEIFSESIWKNEEIGEKRVNYFISLATAVIGGVVALFGFNYEHDLRLPIDVIATCALAGLLGFGVFTFLRMLHRNRVTDEYKEVTDYIRYQITSRNKNLGGYVLPLRQSSKRLIKWRGGLAETVGLMNSIILGIIPAFWVSGPWRWIIVALVIAVALTIQLVAAAYRDSPRSQYFRAGAGAVILNKDNQVLAFERKDKPGAYQFPQGGLDEGEEPEKTVFREVKEETGIKKKFLVPLSSRPRLLAYELPVEYRRQKTGRGQTQYWFFFRFTGTEDAITLGDKKEFSKHKWTTIDDLAEEVVGFRKPVYERLAEILPEILKEERKKSAGE